MKTFKNINDLAQFPFCISKDNKDYFCEIYRTSFGFFAIRYKDLDKKYLVSLVVDNQKDSFDNFSKDDNNYPILSASSIEEGFNKIYKWLIDNMKQLIHDYLQDFNEDCKISVQVKDYTISPLDRTLHVNILYYKNDKYNEGLILIDIWELMPFIYSKIK